MSTGGACKGPGSNVPMNASRWGAVAMHQSLSWMMANGSRLTDWGPAPWAKQDGRCRRGRCGGAWWRSCGCAASWPSPWPSAPPSGWRGGRRACRRRSHPPCRACPSRIPCFGHLPVPPQPVQPQSAAVSVTTRHLISTCTKFAALSRIQFTMIDDSVTAALTGCY